VRDLRCFIAARAQRRPKNTVIASLSVKKAGKKQEINNQQAVE
jgi:hypothetical protein